jgi:molybdopterin-guanine dinucleotide biosynthesis protein A
LGVSAPQPDKLAPEAAGFVLAGGQSSRMGVDKALLPLAGRPLVAHAVAILRDAGLTAAIAGARSPLAGIAPVVEDFEPGLGPLAGICAALASTSAPLAVFLPVDLPFLPATLITYMVHHARVTRRPVTLCAVNGYSQTFPAVLCKTVLPPLQAELAFGRRGCYSAFQAAAAAMGQPMTVLPVELLVQSGQVRHPGAFPAFRWFLNVNTPQDLRRAGLHSPPPVA